MKIKPKGLAVSIALSIAATAFPQKPVTASDTGMAALRAFAAEMEKCPDAFVLERHWGKGRSEIERVYLGHPKNVVAGSAQVDSRPVGYIEFASSFYVRVPAEAAKKYARQRVVEPAEVPVTAEGVPFLPTEDGFPIAATRYRYEFDFRNDGISLAKMLRSSPDGTWQAVEVGYPCAAKPK